MPPRSETTVGSAVATIVWSSDASSIASSSPANVAGNERVEVVMAGSYSHYKNKVKVDF